MKMDVIVQCRITNGGSNVGIWFIFWLTVTFTLSYFQYLNGKGFPQMAHEAAGDGDLPGLLWDDACG